MQYACRFFVPCISEPTENRNIINNHQNSMYYQEWLSRSLWRSSCGRLGESASNFESLWTICQQGHIRFCEHTCIVSENVPPLSAAVKPLKRCLNVSQSSQPASQWPSDTTPPTIRSLVGMPQQPSGSRAQDIHTTAKCSLLTEMSISTSKRFKLNSNPLPPKKNSTKQPPPSSHLFWAKQL